MERNVVLVFAMQRNTTCKELEKIFSYICAKGSLKQHCLHQQFNSYSLILRVRVVLKRTVVGECRFDILSGSCHLETQIRIAFVSPCCLLVFGQTPMYL